MVEKHENGSGNEKDSSEAPQVISASSRPIIARANAVRESAMLSLADGIEALQQAGDNFGLAYACFEAAEKEGLAEAKFRKSLLIMEYMKGNFFDGLKEATEALCAAPKLEPELMILLKKQLELAVSRQLIDDDVPLSASDQAVIEPLISVLLKQIKDSSEITETRKFAGELLSAMKANKS